MSTEADKAYLKKHGIPTLFNELTQDLFKERPENPVQHLIEALKAKKAALGAQPAAAAADAPADKKE